MTSYTQLNFENTSFQMILSPQKEIIWNSLNVMIDGKPLFYRCWFENNVTRVEDLLDNNGNAFIL